MNPAQEQIIFEVQQSFEVWRSTRQGRERVPEELWVQAISLCSFLAPTRVCKILGVNYPGLRKRLRKRLRRSASDATTPSEKEPLFLTLPDGLGKETSQVRVELSGSSSARMSLDLSVDHLDRLFPLALRVLEITEK